MNNISARQNEEKFIDLIAAFRQKYTDVKKMVALQWYLSVLIPVILSIITIGIKSTHVSDITGVGVIDISRAC